jgi:hypothetical protein
VGKEKAKYCYLTFPLFISFSAINFHVDSCTLGTAKGEKAGMLVYFMCPFLRKKPIHLADFLLDRSAHVTFENWCLPHHPVTLASELAEGIVDVGDCFAVAIYATR